MIEEQWAAIREEIERGTEGDAFTVNVRTRSGAYYEDRAIRKRSRGVIELTQPDRPPLWIDIDAIESLELVG